MTAPPTSARRATAPKRGPRPARSPAAALGADLGPRVAAWAVSLGGAAILLALSLAPGARLASVALDAVHERLLGVPPMPAELEEPAVRSVVYDREGEPIAVLRTKNRRMVTLDEVPDHVRHAVLATEDRDFYDHEGVDWGGTLRAAVSNVWAGDIVSGGSTLTQQLVKNRLVGDAETYDRKTTEAVYALELEQRFTKAEILAAYLNEVYLANGVYGIGTAAEYYWGKDVADLTVEQGALLAGMIRSPKGNDPTAHPGAAVSRRNVVLDQMRQAGFLDADEARRAASRPLELDVHEVPEPRNPAFVDYVRSLLKADPALGEDEAARDRAVLRGGLEIHTTLDPDLQALADEVITDTLDEAGSPQGALTAVDPRTGEVLAIGLGPKPYGTGPGESEVNPAVPGLGGSGRQAGSSFKAFEVVAALEEGVPPTHAFNAPARYRATSAACGNGWAPANYAHSASGLIDMAEATARSSNTYFAHLVDEVTGPAALADTAERLGITTPLEPFCSLVLGTAEVFPLDMASAFGTLANGGTRCEPFAVVEVKSRDGRTLSRGDGDCRDVVEPGVAARATELLRGPLERGTASRRGRIGRPAAGKTGTTDDYRDAWFVGYIPQLSAAAWVGHDMPERLTDPRCGGPVTGGCLPTMMWQRFMSQAVERTGLGVEAFPEPPPLPAAEVPDVTERPVEEADRMLVEAGFRTITEPRTDYRAAGTVVDQRPGAGQSTPLGTAVYLGVSDGQGEEPTVPSVLGLPIEEARAALADAGLAVELAGDPSDSDAGRLVTGQRPSAGSSAVDVDTVTLEVAAEADGEDGGGGPAHDVPGPEPGSPHPSGPPGQAGPPGSGDADAPAPSPSPAPGPEPADEAPTADDDTGQPAPERTPGPGLGPGSTDQGNAP